MLFVHGDAANAMVFLPLLHHQGGLGRGKNKNHDIEYLEQSCYASICKNGKDLQGKGCSTCTHYFVAPGEQAPAGKVPYRVGQRTPAYYCRQCIGVAFCKDCVAESMSAGNDGPEERTGRRSRRNYA